MNIDIIKSIVEFIFLIVRSDSEELQKEYGIYDENQEKVYRELRNYW
jgi:hypothetical protein